MTDRSPTTVTSLADLAALAEVSIATVSRSLAGSPLIAEATRERIVALARAHGFRVNRTARNLRLKRTQAIGVALPLGHATGQHLSDPFFMSLLGPLADAIAERGHDLLLSRVVPADDGWLDALIDSGRVDGVILIGQSDQIDVIERAAARGRPLVVWGEHVAGYAQVTVGTDNVLGGRMAADHLIARGRGRLAFLGNPAVPEFAARHRGFLEAAEAAGCATTLLPAPLTPEESHAAIEGFLSVNPVPDGIVAASDVIAMSALRALAARGLALPEAVGVVGYDDVVVAMLTNPPLTTIRQDVVRGAGLLVDLLFRQIAGERVEAVTLAPELVVRGSA